jgi:hypothetical protein
VGARLAVIENQVISGMQDGPGTVSPGGEG